MYILIKKVLHHSLLVHCVLEFQYLYYPENDLIQFKFADNLSCIHNYIFCTRQGAFRKVNVTVFSKKNMSHPQNVLKCVALIAVTERWLLLDIGRFVLFYLYLYVVLMALLPLRKSSSKQNRGGTEGYSRGNLQENFKRDHCLPRRIFIKNQ